MILIPMLQVLRNILYLHFFNITIIKFLFFYSKSIFVHIRIDTLCIF
jgi:hypothetical protein